jgi:hypothetical protein
LPARPGSPVKATVFNRSTFPKRQMDIEARAHELRGTGHRIRARREQWAQTMAEALEVADLALGVEVAEVHRANRDRARQGPITLGASTTHSTEVWGPA